MWPFDDPLSIKALTQMAAYNRRKDPDWLYEARIHANRMAPYYIVDRPLAARDRFKAKARAYFERIKPERSMFG